MILVKEKRGEIVEITLTSGANVRLMDSSNFSSYKNGRRHSYIGGLAKRSHIGYRSLHQAIGILL